MWLTVMFAISAIAHLLVAAYIFMKGSRNFSYLLFFGIGAVTWIWAILNFLSLMAIGSVMLIYIIRGIMLSAVLQMALFYLFARHFPDGQWIKADKRLLGYGLFVFMTAGVTLTPYMFRSVKVVGGIAHISVAGGIAVFLAFMLYSITMAFRLLYQKYARASGLQRTQLFLLLLAASLNWIVVPFTNFCLTLLLNTTVFVGISPLYGLLFSGIIGYAVARHYLFDFHKIMKDSVIYVAYYLKDASRRSIQYYELQTLIYRARTDHVALDFSGVKALDSESLVLLRALAAHTGEQGKSLYFTGYTNGVFRQLKQADLLKIRPEDTAHLALGKSNSATHPFALV